MKTSTIGIVSAAILMLVAGVGIGIAQADGNHAIGEAMGWQAVEQGSSSDPYNVDLLVETGNLPEPIDAAVTNNIGEAMEGQAVEFVPEGNWAGTDWQARGPVETGAIPEMVPEESWMKEYGID